MANTRLQFSFGENPIRTIDENGQITFCLVDVCKALALSNPSKVAVQIKDEFSTPNLKLGVVLRPDGSTVQATFITEPQLYFVMMRSRAKVAHEFRQWIVNKVLPEIRRRGSYSVHEEQSKNKEQVTKSSHRQPNWYEREILTLLMEKVSNDVIGEVFEVAYRVWRQGYAVACEKFEKAAAQNPQLPQIPEGSIILEKKDADRLRNMLHYMPQVLNLLGEAGTVLNIIKKSKLLVPAYEFHFALEHEAECLKKAVGE